MRSVMQYPIDAISDAMSSAWWRTWAFVLFVVIGLVVGRICASGWDFALLSALGPLAWAALAWLVFPSYFVVNVVSLCTLVAMLVSESRAALSTSAATLIIAWAWFAYIWA